jgi:hypothetical protein
MVTSTMPKTAVWEEWLAALDALYAPRPDRARLLSLPALRRDRHEAELFLALCRDVARAISCHAMDWLDYPWPLIAVLSDPVFSADERAHAWSTVATRPRPVFRLFVEDWKRALKTLERVAKNEAMSPMDVYRIVLCDVGVDVIGWRPDLVGPPLIMEIRRHVRRVLLANAPAASKRQPRATTKEELLARLQERRRRKPKSFTRLGGILHLNTDREPIEAILPDPKADIEYQIEQRERWRTLTEEERRAHATRDSHAEIDFMRMRNMLRTHLPEYAKYAVTDEQWDAMQAMTTRAEYGGGGHEPKVRTRAKRGRERLTKYLVRHGVDLRILADYCGESWLAKYVTNFNSPHTLTYGGKGREPSSS